MKISDCYAAKANNCVKSIVSRLWSIDQAKFTSIFPFIDVGSTAATRNKMIVNENGRTLRANATHTAWNRARSHLITNLSMLIPAGKSFRFIRVYLLLLLPLLLHRKSANRNFLLFVSLSPSTTILPRSYFCHSHSLPWRIFRGNANSGSLTSTLESSDISHRRRGREVDVRVRKDRSYTENISRTNFSISFPVSSGNLNNDKRDLTLVIKKSC